MAVLAIATWLFLDPGVNVPRRILDGVVDNSGATASFLDYGDLAASVFVVYLWVTFGNGFRYGRRCLLLPIKLDVRWVGGRKPGSYRPSGRDCRFAALRRISFEKA